MGQPKDLDKLFLLMVSWDGDHRSGDLSWVEQAQGASGRFEVQSGRV